MNKLMTVLLALMISVSAFAGEGFDKLYSKYAASDEVTSINLTKSLLSIAANFMGDKDEDAKELIKSIESVKNVSIRSRKC